MKIARILVHQVTLPLEYPYWLSGARLYFDQLDSTIVAVETDNGPIGWGEGCPWGSTYLPASHLPFGDTNDLTPLRRLRERNCGA